VEKTTAAKAVERMLDFSSIFSYSTMINQRQKTDCACYG
jgi:hypothetical protein